MAAMGEKCEMNTEGMAPARMIISKKLPEMVTKLYLLKISEKDRFVEIRLL
jgi:hypothetical protein